MKIPTCSYTWDSTVTLGMQPTSQPLLANPILQGPTLQGLVFCHCSSGFSSHYSHEDVHQGICSVMQCCCVASFPICSAHRMSLPLPQKEKETSIFFVQVGGWRQKGILAQYCASPLSTPGIQARSTAEITKPVPIQPSHRSVPILPQLSLDFLRENHHICTGKEKPPK